MLNNSPEQTLGEALDGLPEQSGLDRIFRDLVYGFELVKVVLILFMVGLIFNTFVATVFRISGVSMEPNFHEGQFVAVNRIAYAAADFKRGDVIVLQFPADPEDRKFIKRVIGLPGEVIIIKNGQVSINNQLLDEKYLPAGTITQPELIKVIRDDEVFVIGDNRPNSNDSRFWGALPLSKVIGKVELRINGLAVDRTKSPTY